jgi:hypothetical protein
MHISTPVQILPGQGSEILCSPLLTFDAPAHRI